MAAIVSTPEMKRQLLMASDTSGVKKIMRGELPEGWTEDEIIEAGKAFDSLTQHKGWLYVENFMLKDLNVVTLVAKSKDPTAMGRAQGFIDVMQWVDIKIKEKNAILARANKDMPEVREDES